MLCIRKTGFKFIFLIFDKLLLFQLYIFMYILFNNFINCHPTPSANFCHGIQPSVNYVYKYKTTLLLNNNDHQGKEPVGFGFACEVVIRNVWEDDNNYFLKIYFAETPVVTTRQGKDRGPLGFIGKTGKMSHNYPLYARFRTDHDGEELVSFYVNSHESISMSNIKKAIISQLRTKSPKDISNITWSIQNGQLTKRKYSSNIEKSINSILVPEVIDEWSSSSQLSRDHSFVKSCDGWQNVSLTSKMYRNAHSKLHTRYTIELIKENEVNDKTGYEIFKTPEKVIELLGDNYIEEMSSLEREKKVCEDCMTLKHLMEEIKDGVSYSNMATLQISSTYLKVLERVRSGGPGTSEEDIIKILKYYQNNEAHDVLSFLIDVVASAYTEHAFSAAMRFLNLPKNENLDLTERFLVALAVSAITLTESHLTSNGYSSHEYVVKELLKVSKARDWTSFKLKYSTLTTLATILRAHNSLMDRKNINNEMLNKDVMKLLNFECENCEDSECRTTMLHAIASARNLKLSIDILEKFALNPKLKRESIASMKAIKDCLTFGNMIDGELRNRIIKISTKVLYHSQHETTSRIIASEIIIAQLKDKGLSNMIAQDVIHFEDFEMSTLMWNKAIRQSEVQVPISVNNWFFHSTVLNGTSDSYKRIMGGTQTINATYAIAMELLNRGKLLKESAFDVEISGEGFDPKHILSVNLFARGLKNFAGGSDVQNAVEDEAESTSAGMSLRVLDVPLRPYIFFTGTGELMGHVWSGTGSEPSPVFGANLLVSDYTENHQLNNGFVVNQEIRGVMSLDLSGEIQISLWNRNSHSVVRTKAALLMKGSQTILTSDVKTKTSQAFAFGGSSSVEFITDLDFYSTPFKMCMQISQPDFLMRHITRKREQINSDEVERRIHRRSYLIPAKSFALHRDNNYMCSMMQNN